MVVATFSPFHNQCVLICRALVHYKRDCHCFFLNAIYLAIDKSQQYPTKPNQNHILEPSFLSSTCIFKFFKNTDSLLEILTGFLSRYFSQKYFIFPSRVCTEIGAHLAWLSHSSKICCTFSYTVNLGNFFILP